VEELIRRLRDEGVQEGQNQSQQLVRDAQTRADALLADAQQQASQILQQARKEAENLKASGKQALELAFRDTVLALKTQLTQRFTGEVRRLVGDEQQKLELLEKLILEVAGRARPDVDQSEQVEVLLPTRVAGVAELSQNPEELENGILTRFIRLNTQSLLKEGISFGFAEDKEGGLRLRLVDRGIVLDLTDQAIADALLVHLQPRFRALLEGVVK
jgi:V/A-type H+-transporting ATPase subunit E